MRRCHCLIGRSKKREYLTGPNPRLSLLSHKEPQAVILCASCRRRDAAHEGRRSLYGHQESSQSDRSLLDCSTIHSKPAELSPPKAETHEVDTGSRATHPRTPKVGSLKNMAKLVVHYRGFKSRWRPLRRDRSGGQKASVKRQAWPPLIPILTIRPAPDLRHSTPLRQMIAAGGTEPRPNPRSARPHISNDPPLRTLGPCLPPIGP